jgi:hypothetical protein
MTGGGLESLQDNNILPPSEEEVLNHCKALTLPDYPPSQEKEDVPSLVTKETSGPARRRDFLM